MPTNEKQQDVEVDEALEAEATAAESVGDILRAERSRKGLTEKDVADQLHITMHYVRAIESNSFEKLPGAVFVKGYIKSYALLLGLEESQVIGSYDVYVSEQQDAAREKTRIQVRRRKDKNRPWVIGSGIAFVSLFLILWFFNSGTEETVESDLEEPSQSESSNQSERLPEGEVDDNLVAMAVPVLVQLPTLIDSSTEALSQDDAGQLQPVVVGELIKSAGSAELVALADSQNSIIAELSEVGAPDNQVQSSLELADSRSSQHSSRQPSETPASIDIIESTVLAPNDESAEIVETLNVAEFERSDGRILVETEGSDVLLITLVGVSWLEVSDGFENLLYRDLTQAGDVLEIKGTAPFDILLGDAPFAKMNLNGIDIDVSKNTRIDNSARLTVGL